MFQFVSCFIGVIGFFGVGKSSFFWVLVGVEKCVKVVKLWFFEKIGIVFQQFMLFLYINVWGNLVLVQCYVSFNVLLVEVCVKGCYCEYFLEKFIDLLLGGEVQCVVIVWVLVNGFFVLLLDELLSVIDIFIWCKIYQFLNILCVFGQFICFVIFYDLDDLVFFSDELVYVE